MKSATPKVLHRSRASRSSGHVLATAARARRRATSSPSCGTSASGVVAAVTEHAARRRSSSTRTRSPAPAAPSSSAVGRPARRLRRRRCRAQRRRPAARRRRRCAGLVDEHRRSRRTAATLLSRLPRRPDGLRPHRARAPTAASTASSSRRTPPTTELAIAEINAGIYVFGVAAAARPRSPRIGTAQRAGREVPHRRASSCCAARAREIERACPCAEPLAGRRHQRPRPAQRGRAAS